MDGGRLRPILPPAAIHRIPPTVPCALIEPHPPQRMPVEREFIITGEAIAALSHVSPSIFERQ